MRCLSCNKNLNDFESTRKNIHGGYIDMCSSCFSTIESDFPNNPFDDPMTGDEEDWNELEEDLHEQVSEF